MKELIPMDTYGMFADMHDTARVSSLKVAEMFEKDHDKVCRDIESLDCSREFNIANFGGINYTDSRGRKQKAYAMTRDGFVFLCMGYRGKKAAQFKEAYIHRFNEMEKHIAQIVAVRKDYPQLTEAVKMAHENPKPYHYSTEADMLNKIITGYTAKQFREMHGIPKGESIRPYMTPAQIGLMDKLQKADIGLCMAVSFDQRKKMLEWLAMKTVAQLTA
jgi:phage regulatory protein, rha family